MGTSVESNKDLVARGVHSNLLLRRPLQIFIFFVGFALMLMFLYNDTSSFKIPLLSQYFITPTITTISDNPKLESFLRNASMENSTVIITTLNGAWAEPNLMFDIFLKSFHDGIETERLLKHLVVITLDEKAHARCQALHPHCYQLETKGTNFTKEALYMTKHYLDMMWRRIELLGTVLEMGYNFASRYILLAY
ncbi:hypothetical protein PIB30_042754 [Stylosanthes scabra]|uniref:Nucleotide-diphospho-sugar transferase domain-containing protein n=1 Tax=Stylosanthes scabra TaxID=79078 RepID=A0ABU6TEY5_9FABA|nr:hypothetical protein [Stylosanthes scabra]